MQTSLLDFKKNSATNEFPNSFASYVKEGGDIFFWPQGGFHLVTNAEMAKTVLTSKSFSADRSQFFISRMPNLDLRLIGDFFGVVQKMMVMSDGKKHIQMRQAAALGFEEHIIARFKSQVEQTVHALLTEAFAHKEFDFMEKIAKKLPSTVLADLFSIPNEDREDFLRWSNNMTAFFGGASQYRNEDGIEVNKSAVALRTYFLNLIEKRRQKPGSDYISLLIQGQKRFDLSDDEVVSQAIMMLVAGQVTTTDQLGNILYLLLEHEVQDDLRLNPALINNAIEEAKRFDPAVTFLFRCAIEDTSFANHQIKKGDTVFISTHAVNRENSDEFNFDITRTPKKHFAYGHGPHYCIGASFGRLQMNTLFEQMFSKFPKLKLGSEVKRDHYSLSFSGFEKLMVVVQ